MFIRHRYDLNHAKITELCAKCHAFENQQVVEDEAIDTEEDINFNDDISEADEHEENATKEKENGSSVTNDEERNDIDHGKETDGDDSENEEEENGDDGDSFHEPTYQQQQVFETSSSIFLVLNTRPIHDQYVHPFILTSNKCSPFEGPILLQYFGELIEFIYIFISSAIFWRTKSATLRKQNLMGFALKDRMN